MNKVGIKITNNLIERNSKIINEDKYNDPRKYITVSLSSLNEDESKYTDLIKVLCELPEFNADETATITNTGLVVFKDVSTTWAYSIIDIVDMGWGDINPDFDSTSKNYTEFNNPLGVRKIYVNKDKKLTGEVYYKTGELYVFNMDCDLFFSNESMSQDPEEDGTFKSSEYITNVIGYEYKQSRIITFYNCTGTVNGVSQKYTLKEGNDSVYLDFTDNDIYDLNRLEFEFETVNSNAYVEVR